MLIGPLSDEPLTAAPPCVSTVAADLIYKEILSGETHHAAFFRLQIEDTAVNGMDYIILDADGQIAEVAIFRRPLPSTVEMQGRIAPLVGMRPWELRAKAGMTIAGCRQCVSKTSFGPDPARIKHSNTSRTGREHTSWATSPSSVRGTWPVPSARWRSRAATPSRSWDAISPRPMTWPRLSAAARRRESGAPSRPGYYTAFVAWMQNPVTDILMGLLLIALFYHAALGLQVVVEDYVHSGTKFAAMIAVRLTCFTLGAAGILATLRIAAGS